MGDGVQIVEYILNSFIILITCYLIFLYLKSQEFDQYQCYNIIILSTIIFFDNVLRLIPMDEVMIRHIQAFILTLFDKLILTTITCQALILYYGVCHTKLYYKREKYIFFISFFLGLIISMVLTIIYIIIADAQFGKGGITNYDNASRYYYVNGTDFKSIADSIFNGVFLLFNLFFCIVLLIYITKKRKQASLGIIEDLDYGHHNLKIVLMLLINSFMFIESYLIIYDQMPNTLIDLIYLISCLLVDLYYAINKIIIKETLKIFCKKYYDKKYPSIKKNETIDIGSDTDDDYEE